MRTLSYFFLALGWFNPLAASGSSSGAEHHGINWWHIGADYADAPALLWLSITFFIFVWGVIAAIKKPLTLYLETRSKDIRNQIEEGKKAKAESEAKLKEYEERVKSLNEEIKEINESFRKQGEGERREIERIAREEKDRILKDAKDTIAANISHVKNNLAREVIELALKKAKSQVLETSQDSMDEHFKKLIVDELKDDIQGV
jgi:F-type H+-transporting ATPase subunit b